MRISIHVATKDRLVELVLLLHSLKNQTYEDWDLYILDDASKTAITSDRFVQNILTRIKLGGHDIELYRNENSYGVCRARQQMIDTDPYPDNAFILRLDDDVILERNYIDKLVCGIEEGVGWASGVTPLWAQPNFVRNIEFIKPVVNKIEFDKEGNITKYADDCGYEYPWNISHLPAHQFRSNALIRKEALKNVKYPLLLSPVGFREEAFLSLAMAWQGWKGIVIPSAIAWHAPSQQGGCRYPDYQQYVSEDNAKFYAWAKEQFVKNGGEPKVWQE